MYTIPEEKWGEFLSQGDKNWCWAYALGGIFGLTKHEEIARLHETLGYKYEDGTTADWGSTEHVLKRAKEYGYISGYKNLLYAKKERRIQEILKALKEGGIPLTVGRRHAGNDNHEIRAIGVDEKTGDLLVVDSSLIKQSPRTLPYEGCISVFSVDISPENYAKINADFKGETIIEPEKDEIKIEETEVNTMGFVDVKEQDWFYNVVKSCFDKGIINGKDEKRFAPNDTITRAEICAMIDRSMAYVIGQLKKD